MPIINKFPFESQVNSQGTPGSGLPWGCGAAPPSGGPDPGAPLLNLYSNNAIENIIDPELKALARSILTVLTPYHKRQAETLNNNVARLISLAPSKFHVGFVTLTFKDNITDSKEAYRRFNSLNNNFLAPSLEFGHWICVKEPQKRGAWHYHLIVIMEKDIGTGFDWEKYSAALDLRDKKAPYYSPKNKSFRAAMSLATKSASPALRQYWKELRVACSKYGFGRSEILPVRKNAKAMGRYIGKYISKGVKSRSESQKGVRLVSYSKGWQKNSVKFQWFTPGSRSWRKKVEIFSYMNGCSSLPELSAKLGPTWAYKYSDYIFDIDEKTSMAQLWEYARHAKKFNYFSEITNRLEKWKLNDDKTTSSEKITIHGEIIKNTPQLYCSTPETTEKIPF